VPAHVEEVAARALGLERGRQEVRMVAVVECAAAVAVETV
jgi:hypothetical protein